MGLTYSHQTHLSPLPESDGMRLKDKVLECSWSHMNTTGILTSRRILYSTSLFTEPYAFMKSINGWCIALLYSPFFEAFDKCRKYEQRLICYIKIATDDPQLFDLYMETKLREKWNFVCHWYELCASIITIICFITGHRNGYNNWFFLLLRICFTTPSTINKKVKVKFNLEHTRGRADVQHYSFFKTSVLDGGGWSMPCASHFTPRKDTQYPLDRWLGGPHSKSGRVWKISAPPRFDPQTIRYIAIRWSRINKFTYFRMHCPACCLISPVGIWSVPGDLHIFSPPNSHLTIKGTRLGHYWLSCLYLSLLNTISLMHIPVHNA